MHAIVSCIVQIRQFQQNNVYEFLQVIQGVNSKGGGGQAPPPPQCIKALKNKEEEKEE